MIHELDPDQLGIVNTLSGPVLVLSGPGTGKTHVMTCRIAKLIGSGVPRDRILCLTSSDNAACDMHEDLEMILSVNWDKEKTNPKPISREVNTLPILTLHALCLNILRRRIELLGYPREFAVFNDGDQKSLARAVLAELCVPDIELTPSELLFWVEHWKRLSLSPAQAILECDTDKQHLAAIAYQRYQRQLKLYGAIDQNDRYLLIEKLFSQHEKIRDEEVARYDHVLVDDFQNANNSYCHILSEFVGHSNICVFGDDDQSVYGFLNATPEHILSFHRDWPDAKVVRLESNYRSTKAIVECANTLIKFNSKRHDKILRSTRQGGENPRIHQFPNEVVEAQETVKDIQERLEGPRREPRDFTILYRTHEQSRILETELRMAELPYYIKRRESGFDRKEIKDLLTYLDVIVARYPDDVSVLRIINTPGRGIGKKSVETLLNHSIQNEVPLWDLVTGDSVRPKLSATTISGLDDLSTTIKEVQNRLKDESMVDLVRSLISTIDYKNVLDRIYAEPDESNNRWFVVQQLVDTIDKYEQESANPGFHDFLDRRLLNEQNTNDRNEDQLKKNSIRLMTLHSASGLEFPEVYLVGLEEGILPNYHALRGNELVEEERRLCYMGMTRAKERLVLSMALSRIKAGKPRDTIPSRFLYELTGKTDNPNYRDKYM